MEPTLALSVIETSLRLIIQSRLPDWETNSAAPDVVTLREKQTEEARRRDGAVVSSELLDFTNTYDLTKLITSNWEAFKPVFDDKRRTETYFSVLEDFRNTIAHSRELLEFERDQLSGIAGLIRNQVAIARSSTNKSSDFYPLIEKVVDRFGNGPSAAIWSSLEREEIRLEVGDELVFTVSANPASGQEALWKLVIPQMTGVFHTDWDPVLATGDNVTLRLTLTEFHVGEDFRIHVILTTASPHHRHSLGANGYDDYREFSYAVNPPRP